MKMQNHGRIQTTAKQNLHDMRSEHMLDIHNLRNGYNSDVRGTPQNFKASGCSQQMQYRVAEIKIDREDARQITEALQFKVSKLRDESQFK